jgi:uncharacterized protein YPO0396
VFNWGTFDGKVHVFSPDCGTALLTGESGSGKTTIVDAILTLLISPRKIMYNKAADATAKERSLRSYVRGQYGLKSGADGAGVPETLRDYDAYAVLLAVFRDAGLNREVTLAKYFRFTDRARPPEAVYVVARRALSVKEDFVIPAGDFAALKKKLREADATEVFDDYKRYAEALCAGLGIENMQALGLFQQTVAMKKVEDLTGFIRENMLEDPSPEEDIEKLTGHFQDLNSAHEAVLRSKNQIEMLAPIVKDGAKREKEIGRRTSCSDSRAALSAWFAGKKLALLETEIERGQNDAERADREIRESGEAEKELLTSIDTTKAEIRNNGGDALENLKADIRRFEDELARVEENRIHYTEKSGHVGIAAPDRAEGFEENKRRFAAIREDAQSTQNRLDEERYAGAVALDRVRSELKAVREELDSLRTRQSSIPTAQIAIRRRLCADLNIPEDDLPNIGELIEVRDEEVEWEGAIERLTHNFGLSLLVPDELYREVMEWVDRTDLRSRLVYYRVRSDAPAKPLQTPASNSVIEKVNIKSDSAFFGWLHGEIIRRFPHICCGDLDSFAREQAALTPSGQIKSGGLRHEKDDRYDLGDRSRYILGFSNRKKIEALGGKESELIEEENSRAGETRRVDAAQKDLQARLEALSALESIRKFDDIDTARRTCAIREKRDEVARLESENDLLAALEKRLTERTGALTKLKEKQQGLYSRKAEIEAKTQIYITEREKASDIVARFGETLAEQSEVIDAFRPKAIGDRALTLDVMAQAEADFREWIENEIDKSTEVIEKAGNRIVKQMTDFNNKYPAETREVDANVESLPDYERMLETQTKDDLPRFETRFKELLNQETIEHVALFQANLSKAQEMIRRKIEQINGSLSDIDYNDGRFIKLVYKETNDTDIREFRAQLRSCTEGALAGGETEQYAEEKFLQVRAIIERFRGRQGETERDKRWTKKVTDVRNWFVFSASERWRYDDSEYEHYTDSGGKSGGQKEKLAYMILAASLVYHYGINTEDERGHAFRFVVIDEAFLKSSDESAKFGLTLFKKLDLQLLIVTPLLKIHTIEPYITHVGYVYHDDASHLSVVRNMSIEEFTEARSMAEREDHV